MNQIRTSSDSKIVKRYLDLANLWNNYDGANMYSNKIIFELCCIIDEAERLLKNFPEELNGTIVFTKIYKNLNLSFPIS